MKKTLVSVLLGIAAVSLEARTWTSADGTRTFEGELKSYDAASGLVTVSVNGRPLEFSEDKLSAADVAFLKEASSPIPSASPSSAPTSTAMAGRLAKVKLSRLDGKRFRRAELNKEPEYYILYYSASW